MALFVLADTHLGSGIDKSMDLFGPRWENHAARLSAAWQATVGDDDTVLVPGDISWALKLEEAIPDLKTLNDLPGRKILLRGNHDYWWQSLKQIAEVFEREGFDTLSVLQNDAVYLPEENTVICGSRGWLQPGDKQATGHDKKIYHREVNRLRLSLDAARKLKKDFPGARLIAMLHYPPFGPDRQPSEVTRLLTDYGVERAYYGHVHHVGTPYAVTEWPLDGVRYTLIAADHLNFKPYLIPQKEEDAMNPIRSMTGYGRGEVQTDLGRIEVELRSLNHRYLEVYCRTPQELNFADNLLRNKIKERVARGKIDLRINYDLNDVANDTVRVNVPLAKAYAAAYEELGELLGDPTALTTKEAFQLPEILKRDETSLDEDSPMVKELLLPGLDRALDAFIASREKEGEALKEDIAARLDILEDLLAQVEKLAPEMVDLFRERLLARLAEMLEDEAPEYYPEQRVASEVAIFADKVAIAEETVRLGAHFKSARDLLARGGVIGKKFDFLIQEMNREVNTIASKANHLDVTNLTVEMKNQVEKIREQVQNIE